MRQAAILVLAGVIFACACPEVSARDDAPQQTPYAQWKNGPPSDASYFPIAVWLQSPAKAERYKAAGINLYVGLWKGPTEQQLAALKAAGMPVICDQNEFALAHKDDEFGKIIVGWMHGDEPDNAQPIHDPKTGKMTGYGPPVKPSKIVRDYEAMKAADPTRPVLLNLGQGVANDQWIGRGNEGKPEDYPQYVKGCDVASFDVYPVAGLDKPDGENYLWYVAKGVGRLVDWTEGRKPVWNCIECTRIGSERKATPAQVRAEVWMSLVNGSRGILYFVHEWKPRFNEHALLDDPEMLAAVTEINREIRELAPVLNAPPAAPDAASVRSSSADVPVAMSARRHGGALYVFAVAMRNGETRGTFQLAGVPAGAKVEVIREGRTLDLKDGRFADDFGPYGVHLYRVAPGGTP